MSAEEETGSEVSQEPGSQEKQESVGFEPAAH